jgi:hypothetical protein
MPVPSRNGTGSANGTAADVWQAPTEAVAAAAARRVGHRVEVTSMVTETRQVFANPSGTMTLEEYARPVRVHRGDNWVPVDTTLRVRPDGVVAPAAAVADVTFSGGGDATPLVSLTRGTGRLALRWPGRLPTPVLSGGNAVYRQVLPGVDLKMTATVDGFSDVLIVHDRAATDALTTVRLGIQADGIKLAGTKDGGFTATDATGTSVLSAPVPQMWDATAGESGGVPSGRRAVMGLQVGADSLTLTPDRQMLADPTTRYPVYLDPSVSVSLTLVRWGNILGYPASLQSQTISQDPDKSTAKSGMGCTASDSQGNCTGTKYLYRSVFDFSIGVLAHRHILKATFTATLQHSWSCSNTPTELWNVGGAISDSYAWNTLGWPTYLVTRWSFANCGTNGGPIEFGDQGGPVTLNLQNFANGGWQEYTLGLKATDESDVFQWKRWDPATKLAVDYNAIPWPPSELTVGDKGCATGSNRPYIATDQPKLTARLSDQDSGQSLSATFQGGLLGATASTWGSQGGIPATGGTAQITTSPGILRDGNSYFLQATTSDGIDTSAVSSTCEFTVDLTPPGPATVTSTDYPTTGFVGVVGKTGRFVLHPPATNPGDVDHYLVGRDCKDPGCGISVPASATDHTGIIDYTPKAGPQTLWVWTVDKADQLNTGDPFGYTFSVRSDTTPQAAPAAQWSLDENTGTALADNTKHGNDATMSGGAGWFSPGRPGGGAEVRFNGVNAGMAATSGTVMGRDTETGAAVAVRTDQSFSVSAWVRMTSLPPRTATIASVDGSQISAFRLAYAPDVDRFVFTTANNDAAPYQSTSVRSDASPTLGEWAYLMGVYDEGAQEIRLFVNGVPQGTMPYRGTWNATGVMRIGAGKTSGAVADYFYGDIDDVRLYNRVLPFNDQDLFKGEVGKLVNAPSLANDWELVDSAGTTAKDTGGGVAPINGTLSGGTTWVPVNPANASVIGGFPSGANAARFDGSTGMVRASAGPSSDVTAAVGGSLIAGNPSVIVDTANSRELAFARDNNGHLREFISGAGGTWTSTDLTQAVGAVAIAGDPYVFTTTNVFVRDANSHLVSYSADSAGKWTVSDLSNASGVTIAGDPAYGIGAAWARGSNNHLYQFVPGNGTWAAWDLTAMTSGVTVAGDPVLQFTSPAVWIRDTNNHLRQFQPGSGGSWSANDVSAASGVAIGGNPYLESPGSSIAWATDTGGHLRRFTGGGSSWSATDVTAAAGGVTVVGDPVVSAGITNATTAYVRDGAGHLRLFFAVGSGWSAHDLTTNMVGGVAITGRPVVLTGANGAATIYARDTNGHLRRYAPGGEQTIIDTAQSFTVTAWARITTTGAWQTVVGIGGSTWDRFRLAYDPTHNEYTFSMADVDSGAFHAVWAINTAQPPPVVGQWTHLAGVYDAMNHKIHLYVDGLPVATSSMPTALPTSGGPVRIGTGQGNSFAGDVASVRLYYGVVSDDDIANLAAGA